MDTVIHVVSHFQRKILDEFVINTHAGLNAVRDFVVGGHAVTYGCARRGGVNSYCSEVGRGQVRKVQFAFRYAKSPQLRDPWISRTLHCKNLIDLRSAAM